jgi:AraC-like DNA-binding protein
MERKSTQSEDSPADRAREPPRMQHIEHARGEPGLRVLRDEAGQVCEITAPGSASGYLASTVALHLGSIIVIETRTTPLRYDRTALHVARVPVDHYLVQLHLRGGSRVWCAGREIVCGAGDIVVNDMTCPNRTISLPAPGDAQHRHLTFFVPRPLLAPLLAAPDAIAHPVIAGHTPYGRVLRSHLLAIYYHGAALTREQSEAVTRGLPPLIAAGIHPTSGSEPAVVTAVSSAKRLAIQRYLERRLDTPSMDIAVMCRTFGISRASLYRMFEPDGGVAAYRRQRRLRRAFAAMLSPAYQQSRIVDIALQHGFRSESGFVRAFRRAFGVSPGEAREVRRLQFQGELDPSVTGGVLTPDARRWMLELIELKPSP